MTVFQQDLVTPLQGPPCDDRGAQATGIDTRPVDEQTGEMVDTLSMNPVDELLHQARQLLGTMTPVASGPTFDASAPVAPAGWESAAATAAASHTETELAKHLGALQQAQDTLRSAIQEADEAVRAAQTRLNAVETSWSSDRAAAAAEDPDEGRAGLLQAAHQYVREVTDVVQHTAEHFQRAAERITAAVAALP